MSIIVGNRIFFPGHRYRHDLAGEILKRNLPVDVWGRGANEYSGDRVKGSFRGLEPYKDYKFTIAIENNDSESYITEKYTNAIACGTVPLYFGANRISTYFGDQWGFRLNGKLEEDIVLIENVLRNPEQYRIDLSRARHELKHGKCNFANFVLNKFEPLV